MDGSNTNFSLSFDIEKNDFSRAGEASSTVKKMLRKLGIDPSIIRRTAIATYEAEMNMVIHSQGGKITVCVYPIFIEIIAQDIGPGIENVELAMREGYSTAPESIREMGFGAGMGLPNMKRCSDYFNIETEPNKFTRIVMKINM